MAKESQITPGRWLKVPMPGAAVEGRPREYRAFVPNPLPPRLDREAFLGRVSTELLAAHEALRKLESLVERLPSANVLLRGLYKREAESSSTIENTLATVEEMSLFEAGVAPDRESVREVHNNLACIEHAIASPLPICTRLLLEMHAKLMDGVRGDNQRPGQVRTIQVHIGGARRGIEHARYVPPPPGPVLDECLRDYERFMNPPSRDAKKVQRWPDLVELAMQHYQFEAIHPFSDGNGRLGRAIVSVAPCKAGLFKFPITNISRAIERRRQEYYDALLGVTTHGHWDSWVRLFLEALAAQAHEDVERVESLHALRVRWQAQIPPGRGAALTLRALDVCFERLAFGAPDLARLLGVSSPTARAQITRMLTLGIVREVTGGKYGRVYLAQQIVGVLNGEPGY